MASTVRSIQARPDAHGDYFSEESARQAALDLNRAGELLATALGPGRVLRIPLADLVEAPAPTLGACLRFLGEEEAGVAALPLAALGAAGHRLPTTGGGIGAAEARRLLETGPPTSPSLPARLRGLVAALVDDDAVVAVVSRGDDALLELGRGRAQHFPATDDGAYAGAYPATGIAAVALLEEARAAGVTHLLVPAPASWWLTHYWELGAHLDRRYRAVADAPTTGTLYDLRTNVEAVR